MKGKLAVGVLAATAITGTAVAQTAPSHTVDASVSPSKAGTKKKPRNVTTTLNISNNREAGTTASRIEINLPSGLKMNPRGFPVCSETTITEEGIEACPSKSRLGTGTAAAVVNPTSPTPSNLTFRNTFFVGGSNFLNIFLEQSPGDVRAVLKGTITQSGRKLSIDIPEDLQQPAPGVYSALTDIRTKLKGTTGSGSRKHGFFELFDCKGGKGTTTTKLTYVPNPNPPAASSSTATDTSRCSK